MQTFVECNPGLLRGLLSRDPKRRLGAGHEGFASTNSAKLLAADLPRTGYAKLKAHPFFKSLCVCLSYSASYSVPRSRIHDDVMDSDNHSAICKGWEKLLCREYDPPYIPASEKYAEDCRVRASNLWFDFLRTLFTVSVSNRWVDFRWASALCSYCRVSNLYSAFTGSRPGQEPACEPEVSGKASAYGGRGGGASPINHHPIQRSTFVATGMWQCKQSEIQSTDCKAAKQIRTIEIVGSAGE